MLETKPGLDILEEIKRIKQAEEADRLEIIRIERITQLRKQEIYRQRIHEEELGLNALAKKFYLELRHLGIVQMIAQGTSVPAWLWDGDCKTLEPENQPVGPTLNEMTAKQRKKFYNSQEWKNRVLAVSTHRPYQVSVLKPRLDSDNLVWTAPLRIRAISSRELFGRDRFYDQNQHQPYIEVRMNLDRNLSIEGQEVSEIYLPPGILPEEAQLKALRPLAQAFVHPFKPEVPPKPRIDPNLVVGVS